MTARAPYVMAIAGGQLFADRTYQREVAHRRVKQMAAEFDPRLLGVLEVSARDDGRYAILDGQHRHAAAASVRGDAALFVCQVHEGLTVEDEARLFHEINTVRKQLNFWDKWKSRRAAGDERVLAIEQVLANNGLKVDPAPRDGNIAAMAALEIIADEIGGLELLDQVVVVLLSAFGRDRAAFGSIIMEGLGYVLAIYPPDELDRDRLVRQLSEMPVRQLQARAMGLREMHKGRHGRLVAAVIVDQYNRGAGRKVEPLFARLPTGAQVSAVVKRHRRTAPRVESGEPAIGPGQPGENEAEGAGLAGHQPLRSASSPEPDTGRCCMHSPRMHDSDGLCLAEDCVECPGYRAEAIA